jgi:hypothetical protein
MFQVRKFSYNIFNNKSLTFYRFLNCDRWLEMQDIEWFCSENCNLSILQKKLEAAARQSGRELRVSQHLKTWMVQEGFVDIHYEERTWTQRSLADRNFRRIMLNRLSSVSLRLLTQYGNMKGEEVRKLLGRAREDFTNWKIEISWSM